MKTQQEINPEKLRGGYYTSNSVVDFCLNRIRILSKGHWPKRWLEPSCGNGAFIRGIARIVPIRFCEDITLIGVEIHPEESAKSAAALNEAELGGCVLNQSFFEWALSDKTEFDAVVGNPPFVRYQFVPADDRRTAEELLLELGINLRGVSNYWIPFALISLDRIRIGGIFAFVLPTELFCTVSGGQFREYLIRNFTNLSIDLFPRGTFKGILQDIVVVSGQRAKRIADKRVVSIVEHGKDKESYWTHNIAADQVTWTRYLLTELEYDAFKAAIVLEQIYRISVLARIEVAIVTGANKFFTIDQNTVDKYALHPWVIPLLSKTIDAPGVIFTPRDLAAARSQGSRTWLLSFSADRPVPNGPSGVTAYLASGEAQGLPERYKCRIRKPWYRVPHITRGSLMMTKRAHHYHRLLFNQAKAFTTDTIYRGEMLDQYCNRESDLVALFQNTLTLLSTEIEGRTYGGGVLELVPSEISRLVVPFFSSNGLLDQVDVLSREVNGQRDSTHAVMKVTDEFLSLNLKGYSELLPYLDSAHQRLQSRRQVLATG